MGMIEESLRKILRPQKTSCTWETTAEIRKSIGLLTGGEQRGSGSTQRDVRPLLSG